MVRRTTIRLDEQLMTEAKGVAAATGRTLTAVIEEALREAFARRKSAVTEGRIRLPTFRGGGTLRPGVDLTNNAALLEIMDRKDAAP